MKTDVRLFFMGNDIPGGALTILGPAGCGPDVVTLADHGLRHVGVTVVLNSTDNRLPVLLQRLQQHNQSGAERRRDLYTEDELSSAPLLLLYPNGEYTVFGGPRLGTQYDLKDACLTCGTGARQTSALFLDVHSERMPTLEGRRAASTFYDDIIVDDQLSYELEALNLKGLTFADVYAVMEDKRQIKLPWRQLRASQTLAPMSPRSTGVRRSDRCPSCGRSGFLTMTDPPPRFVYHARDLAEIDDVCTSWEWFGEPKFEGDVRDALFAHPWFLVAPKVMRVIRAADPDAFAWLPIRVENADGSIEGPVPEVKAPGGPLKPVTLDDFPPEQRALLTTEITADDRRRAQEQRHLEALEVLKKLEALGFGKEERTSKMPRRKGKKAPG